MKAMKVKNAKEAKKATEAMAQKKTMKAMKVMKTVRVMKQELHDFMKRNMDGHLVWNGKMAILWEACGFFGWANPLSLTVRLVTHLTL